MLCPVPVYFSDETLATLDNCGFRQSHLLAATNPFVNYATIFALDNRSNNSTNYISRDYDNNPINGEDRSRSSVTTLVSCHSPSSCSSHTHCYCHKDK